MVFHIAAFGPLDVPLEISPRLARIPLSVRAGTLWFRSQATVLGDALQGLVHVRAFGAFAIDVVEHIIFLWFIAGAVCGELFAGEEGAFGVAAGVLFNGGLAHIARRGVEDGDGEKERVREMEGWGRKTSFAKWCLPHNDSSSSPWIKRCD